MKKIIRISKQILQDLWSIRVAILILAIYFLTSQAFFGRSCPLQILLHIACPGCGLTRAGVLLLTGHFLKAWQVQPCIYGIFLSLLFWAYWRYVKQKRMQQLVPLLVINGLLLMGIYTYRIYAEGLSFLTRL